MAELDIGKEDVHNRKKWKRNVMKRKSNQDQLELHRPGVSFAKLELSGR